MKSKITAISGIAAALILCAAFGASAQAAEWKKLPEDVVLAVHFDMKLLAASELYRSLIEHYGKQIPNPGGEYLEFIEATGFDVEEHLESVTFGAGAPDGNTEGAFYMVVRGDFDRERIDSYLQQSGKAIRGTHGKLTTYVPQEVDFDGPAPMISWTDERTMILASSPDFPKLVRSMGGSGLSAKNSSLGQLLAQAHGQFYMALEIPAEVTNEIEPKDGQKKGLNTLFSRLQNPAAGPMQSLETILITLDAKTGLELAVSASADSPTNGQLVYEMLNSYLTVGRSMAAQNPQAAGIMDHLALAHEGSTVEISLTMSGEDVRAAIQQSQPIADD